MEKIKFLKHTADVKFEANGKDINECFENAAKAMFTTMFSGKVKEKITKKIRIEGRDYENLLYNFLEELIFLLDKDDFFIGRVKINIDEEKNVLNADLFGDEVKKYDIGLSIKAVTYNQMSVKKTKNNWKAVVVLDV